MHSVQRPRAGQSSAGGEAMDGLGIVRVCPGCGRVDEAAGFRDEAAEEIRVSYLGPAEDGSAIEQIDERTVAMYVPCAGCLDGGLSGG